MLTTDDFYHFGTEISRIDVERLLFLATLCEYGGFSVRKRYIVAALIFLGYSELHLGTKKHWMSIPEPVMAHTGSLLASKLPKSAKFPANTDSDKK